MTWLDQLPAEIARLIATRFVAEFATVSAAGVPIDSPLVPFLSEDGATIDSATGLAYPVKADRARRNPRVGMLFEGTAAEPVALLSGMAAVRDRDLQANLERYLAEEILTPSISPDVIDYETITRQAIWYFTRIITCVAPAVIRWWPSPAAMDQAPQEWHAPAGTVWPQSDPSPAGAGSKATWQLPDWRALSRGALARGAAAHLTLLDAEGYPLPIRARAVEVHNEGFLLSLPKWLPWSEGKASVSFQGLEIFIGEAKVADSRALFRCERALPVHPLLAGGPLQPDEATKQALMERIAYELKRRGLELPVMPATPPAPTAGARLRAEDAFAFDLISAPES
jgi:hypothetical protein